MYDLTRAKSRSIEPDVPAGQEPVYGAVPFGKEESPPVYRFILVLDRTGGMLCHTQGQVHLN
jgi:hypothetical protein